MSSPSAVNSTKLNCSEMKNITKNTEMSCEWSANIGTSYGQFKDINADISCPANTNRYWKNGGIKLAGRTFMCSSAPPDGVKNETDMCNIKNLAYNVKCNTNWYKAGSFVPSIAPSMAPSMALKLSPSMAPSMALKLSPSMAK